MKKSLKLLTAMLLAVVMTLSLVTVAAAEEAEGEMDPETFKGSITVTLERKNKPVKGVEVTLYQVGTGAVENNNWMFSLVDALVPTDGAPAEDLNGLKAAEVEAITEALAKRIRKLPAEEKDALTIAAKESDENGKIVFDELGVGVYLVVKTDRTSYEFAPSLVYLPYGSEIGWDEEMAVNPKVSYEYSSDPKPPVNIPEDPPPSGGKDYPDEEIPEEEVPLATLPQTGLLQWPIPVMAAAGLLLFGTGMLVDRKRRSEQ